MARVFFQWVSGNYAVIMHGRGGAEWAVWMRDQRMSDEMPISLVCKKCGEVFGMLLVAPTPKSIQAACTKCVGMAMQGKPATNADEWQEVFKRL
jgi:hypothetical protein